MTLTPAQLDELIEDVRKTFAAQSAALKEAVTLAGDAVAHAFTWRRRYFLALGLLIGSLIAHLFR